MQAAEIIIVGGGAAGSLAAIFAARALREAQMPGRVVVLETRRQPGAKIRVSGGGRCNVLPQAAALADFESRGSPNALRNVLLSWPLADVRDFFERELGLPLVDEARAKVFPRSGDARDVVDALLGGIDAAGAELITQSTVQHIDPPAEATGPFVLTLADGQTWTAKKLIVATGGLSMPRTGSDGHGLAMLRGLGHEVLACAPSLVALTSELSWASSLAGVSVEAKLGAHQHGRALGSARGPVLFTHRGLSGPAALDISRHITLPLALGCAAQGPVTLTAAWGEGAAQAPCARTHWQSELQAGRGQAVASVLRRTLPRRLVEALLEAADVAPDASATALGRDARERLVRLLSATPLCVTGSEGFRTAECTTGGVALSNVAAKSLESRITPGLHLCGEVLDVSGRLGGFNFLWSWTSGRRAGLAAARALVDEAINTAAGIFAQAAAS